MIILDKVPIVYPRRNVRCVAFMASAALIGSMLAAGIPVKRHPIEPWQYVSPEASIGKDKLWELLQDSRFKFIAVVTFLVSPTGSNQTFNVPANWRSGNSKIECIGGGGSGSSANANITLAMTGGGGGAYAAQTKVVLVPGGTATYQIGIGGALVSVITNFGTNGNPGGQTWFNGSTLGSSSCGADAGQGGIAGSNSGAPGARGGLASNCVGATAFNGGSSGSASSAGANTVTATGGGGAGGPNGAGIASANNAVNSSPSGGGAGGNGSGGAGGSPAVNGTAGNGGNGTEFSGSHGSGGGGGASDGVVNCVGGTGGLYGGGGGAAGTSFSSPETTISGAGAQGLIVVTYTPVSFNRGYIIG